MGKISLELSIYPTVWSVVLKDSGLSPELAVVESLWATETLAEARCYRLARKTGQEWVAIKTSVGAGPDDE